MSDERGPAHCPGCAVVEPAGGFDRDDPAGTQTVSRFRCLDCGMTFAWRCYPDDPECSHGPFRYDGERFVFYFGRGTRRAVPAVAATDAARETDDSEPRYVADLSVESYAALQQFLDVASEALVAPGERADVLNRIEGSGGIDWPCAIVFVFGRTEWGDYSADHPDEARVLEPHVVATGADASPE